MFATSAPRIALRVQNIQSVRNMTALSGPPKVKISGLEKAAHFVALAVGMLTIPAWVLTHMRQYRGVAE